MPKASPPPSDSIVSTDGLPEGVTILPVPSAETETGKGRKAKRGRPKAGKLDQPIPLTNHVIATTAPPQLPSVFRPQLADIKRAASKPGAAETKPPASGDTAAPQAESHTTPRPSGKPDPATTSETPATTPHAHTEPGEAATINYGAMLRASLKGRWSGQPVWLALVPAAIAGALIGAAALIFITHSPGAAWAATQAAGPSLMGQLALIFGLYYVCRSLAHGAVIYGSARLSDHRPADHNHWTEAALASQGDRFGLDLGGSLLAAVIIMLIGALAWLGTLTWPVPAILQISGLALGYGALLFLLVSVGMVVSLGHVATTLARLNPWASAKLGWRLFSHHFELAGARLTALVIELLLVLPAGLAVLLLMSLAPPGDRIIAAVIVAVLTAVVGAIAGAGTAIWWQSAYRTIVSADHPAGFNRLMTAHVPSAADIPAERIAVTLIAVLALACGTWPWLAAWLWH